MEITTTKKDLKLYQAIFSPMWPVPYGLILLAKNIKEATKIAEKTVKHTEVKEVKEIKMDEPKVVFYESGDY